LRKKTPAVVLNEIGMDARVPVLERN